jgi:hypothetical protein
MRELQKPFHSLNARVVISGGLIMWRKVLIIGMLLFFGQVLLTSSTWAACEQQDLERAWSAEVWGGGSDGSQCWEQCNLIIGPNGIVEGGTHVDCSGNPSQITGGQLTISSGCVIEGYIDTSNGSTIYVDTGAILEDDLVLGVVEE